MKELIEKYMPILTAMAEKGEEGDVSVLFDKLVYMALHRNEEGADVYYVPDYLDFEVFLADYNKVVA